MPDRTNWEPNTSFPSYPLTLIHYRIQSPSFLSTHFPSSSLGILLSVAFDVTKESFVTKRPFTEVTYTDSRKEGLPFPEVTVCSLSGFWKSKIESESISYSISQSVISRSPCTV